MSRSRRSAPVCGITTARSEKQDKRQANRRLRRKVRTGHLELGLKDVSDVWSFDKDGKARFDPRKHPQLMRK